MQLLNATQAPESQAAIRAAAHRVLRNELLRLALINTEQTRQTRLQLHQDRRKRIEAGNRALGIVGRLTGDSRAYWTRRTMVARNRASRVVAV